MSDKQSAEAPGDPKPGTSLEMHGAMSKSLFESLNVVVEDGKPKFKLNEPVFTNVDIPLKSNFNYDIDDETSFVVLGKSSLDFINTASLADYEQIQQKTSAIDYNSIISTLSQEEIESKVGELLQENMKLKETLTQNNRAMKHHFNTLVSWQDELMKVHGNHKQKFAETRNLVVSLQKENNELKTRLTATGSMIDSRFPEELVEVLPLEKSPKPTEITDQSLEVSTSTNDSLVPSNSSNSTVCSININLNEAMTIKRNYEDIKEQILQHMMERNQAYQEMISTIENKVEKVKESQPSLELTMGSLSDQPNNPGRQEFFKNYTHYNEKLSTLARCYAEQTSRFVGIQECLKRCIDVLEIFESNEPLNLPLETRVKYKKILDECRTQLIDEQSQNIPDRHDLIQAHNQFQKIFSDYNSVLIELENLREENVKIVKRGKEVEREKQELLKEKATMEIEKNQLSMEGKRLMGLQITVNQEKTNLAEEKASLNSQSMLYEAQMRSLQDDMKILQKRHDDMLADSTKLKEEIKQKDIQITDLQTHLHLLKDDAVMNEVLQQQLNLWKTDFEEEQKAKEQLKDERNDLTDQLRALRNYNQQLLQRLNGPNPAPILHETPEHDPIDPFCNVCGSFKTQGQWHGLGFCQPIN